MSTDLHHGQNLDDQPEPQTGQPDDAIEVRRDAPLAAGAAALGLGVGVAYLLQAVGGGGALDWAMSLVTGALGLVHLAALIDSRAPLMVLDHRGVRVRRGREWQGISWPDVERVVHRPRASMVRDGSLTLHDAGGRALGVRLSMSIRLIGCDWHELTDALTEFTDGRVQVEEPGSSATRHDDGGSGTARSPEVPAAAPEPATPTAPPSPGRSLLRGRRAEVVLERTDVPGPVRPAADDETSVILVAQAGAPEVTETSTVVLGALGALDVAAGEAAARPPVPDPVVGPQLVAARTRLGLTVDQLAERTRIRPHVIEAIEVDDFEPCGGDFYARGHLRTLARILGLDVAPLLAEYDERYADAPIDPRRVFEAELAHTRPSGPRGRLNWSVLVAAVMAVVLVWSVARLVMDAPVPRADQPVLDGSPGNRAQLSGATTTPKITVSFTAESGGASVMVRDGEQKLAFDDDLTFHQTAELEVTPPVRISSSDGGLVVVVDGEDRGPIGTTGQSAQQVYIVD